MSHSMMTGATQKRKNLSKLRQQAQARTTSIMDDDDEEYSSGDENDDELRLQSRANNIKVEQIIL